jgi:hypothetical protein
MLNLLKRLKLCKDLQLSSKAPNQLIKMGSIPIFNSNNTLFIKESSSTMISGEEATITEAEAEEEIISETMLVVITTISLGALLASFKRTQTLN